VKWTVILGVILLVTAVAITTASARAINSPDLTYIKSIDLTRAGEFNNGTVGLNVCISVYKVRENVLNDKTHNSWLCRVAWIVVPSSNATVKGNIHISVLNYGGTIIGYVPNECVKYVDGKVTEGNKVIEKNKVSADVKGKLKFEDIASSEEVEVEVKEGLETSTAHSVSYTRNSLAWLIRPSKMSSKCIGYYYNINNFKYNAIFQTALTIKTPKHEPLKLKIYADCSDYSGHKIYITREVYIYPKGLIAYYSFDNVLSGNRLHDDSGYGHDGIMHNIELINGVKGKAAEFNGNAYISLGDTLTNTTLDELTVAAFIKPKLNKPERPGWPNMIFYDGRDGEFQLVMYYNTVQFKVKLSNNKWYIVSYKLPALDKWYYVAGVYEGGDYLRLYVDGDLVDEVNVPSLSLYNPSTFGQYNPTIGAYCSAKGKHWSYYVGAIDELRIYNIALNSSEIKNLYYGYLKRPKPEDQNQKYWTLSSQNQ